MPIFCDPRKKPGNKSYFNNCKKAKGISQQSNVISIFL